MKGNSRLSILCLTILLAVAMASYATARDNYARPNKDMLSPGARASAGMPAIDAADLLFNGISEKKLFDVISNVPTGERRTRGAREIALFKTISPSVVLVSTTESDGSGSVISGGFILTNWHVVGNAQFVGVLYKPENVSTKNRAAVVAARVIKVDQRRDLALLKPTMIPSTIVPIELARPTDLQVGADVHAIGHPKGQVWSYTKGIVSQIRKNYAWSAGDRIEHEAEVIQTQTPINPGNSGGPLLTDDGKLIGVNSFVETTSQGLNFAVSVNDVLAFLAAPSSVIASPKAPNKKVAACDPTVLFEGRNKANNGNIRQISLKCDAIADLVVVLPDDKTAPMLAFLDTKRRNKADAIIFDPSRSAKWQYSYWDADFDETFPLKGFHANGDIKPFRFEKRCAGQAGKDFRCL